MITKPFVCVLFWMFSASAWAASPSCVVLQDGWVRLPPMAAMPMAAGFGVLQNNCAAPMAVVAVRSDQVRDISLHETTLVDGISRMREVERLPIAVGKTAELKPGGLHLMLMGALQPLQEGQRVAVTFVLADGGEVPAELVVRKSGG